MQRFFTGFQKQGEEIKIKEERVVHQLTHVLRAKVGEQIVLLDNTGHEYVVELREITKRELVGKLIFDQSIPDQRTALTVYLAMIKKERFEWALEKLTELGVKRVVPVISERTVIKKKEIPERWVTIIREASEQCERAKLMELGEIVDFDEAVKMASGEKKFIGVERCHPERSEGSTAHTGRRSLPRFSREAGRDDGGSAGCAVDLFIGPEGGWTESEQKLASEHGILPLHLPNTVLRTETAAVALATLVMFHAT